MRTERRSEELLALGMFGRGSRLGDRIEMLLERGRVFSARTSRVRVAASGIALLACLIAGAIAPRWIAFAQARPSFAVASIRPSDPGNHVWRATLSPGGRYTASNMRLLDLVQRAYRVKSFQISGGPSWMDADRFDINAEADSEISDDTLALMLQTLLADRFDLAVHHVTKEQSVYELVVGKSGSKMRWVEAANRSEPQATVYSDRVSAHWASIAWLSDFLSGQLGAPVLDRTGLSGSYSWELAWNPSDPDGPSLFTTLPEQLGLKLQPAKAPVDAWVIDHAERPNAN